jgi:hypothetical protein
MVKLICRKYWIKGLYHKFIRPVEKSMMAANISMNKRPRFEWFESGYEIGV